MNTDDFSDKLGRLMSHMHDDASTNEAARQLHGDVVARQEKLKSTVRTLQESLDHLRLSVKYLVFDLEATRRENQYLRSLLSQPDPSDDDQVS